MRTVRIALALLIAAPAVFAARSGPSSSMPAPPSPQAMAINYYQSGEKRLDKAAKLAEEIKTADAAKVASLKEKLNKTLEGAVGEFKRAVSQDETMYAAYSEMGFALRKLGRYDESLAAYEKALAREQGFSPAIEYRAEAHLALNRLEDAKQAYLLLFRGDRQRADLLLGAMKNWVTERRADPAGLDAKTIDEFAAWVTQREAVHAQYPSNATTAAIRSW